MEKSFGAKLSKIDKKHVKSSFDSPGSLEACAPLWASVGLCGPLWLSVALCGPLWGPVGACGALAPPPSPLPPLPFKRWFSAWSIGGVQNETF